jgi:hypothetical protein
MNKLRRISYVSIGVFIITLALLHTDTIRDGDNMQFLYDILNEHESLQSTDVGLLSMLCAHPVWLSRIEHVDYPNWIRGTVAFVTIFNRHLAS